MGKEETKRNFTIGVRRIASGRTQDDKFVFSNGEGNWEREERGERERGQRVDKEKRKKPNMKEEQLVLAAVKTDNSDKFFGQNMIFKFIMTVAEFVVAGSDYIGVWEETPKSWNWKSFSKTTLPIALRCNGSYDDMIASVIKADELTCEPNDLVISYQMNGRGKIHPTFIKNDRHESLGDNSNESLDDHSMNIHDDPTNVKNQPVDAEDPEPECCEEMQARKYECSDRFRIYKYIGEHSCGIEHANSSHRKISIKVIASLCVNMYRDGKGPNVKDIQRAMFNSFHCSPSYWKCWKGGVVAKEMRFAHMRKVIVVDGTHLHGKYEGVLLRAVSQDTDNHVYPIVFCVVDKENDASWSFFFEKLKETVIDEPNLCFISDRHKSIANGIVKVYNHAHLGENLHWSRAHFSGNRYDVMTTNIAESLNVMLINEREYPMESIFNLIAKRFGELFRERHAYILKSMGNQMVPAAEKIARKKMIEGDSLYVRNVTGDENQFTVFGVGVTAYVDLLEKSCSCRKYDLIKIH
uniref:Transposase-related protein, putative n=1 Tax=Solanum bulbocastanum TaxID=147425 RepID=Q7XA44_SOLBU|nr:Transposase-related protein, putative [Solanum bulbocastanum]